MLQSVHTRAGLTKFPWSLLQESYPSTPPIWFVDSDDPSLAEVLERLEDVRKGSTLVSRPDVTQVQRCKGGSSVEF